LLGEFGDVVAVELAAVDPVAAPRIEESLEPRCVLRLTLERGARLTLLPRLNVELGVHT